MIAGGWERWEEAKVILVFHLVGTAMEVFKTSVGSWEYPEENIFRIGGVPLFTGFMYSAVGSCIARSWRIFDLRFTHYPPFWATAALAVAIYVNFITNHYVWDARALLFPLAIALFWSTRVTGRLDGRALTLPVWPLFFAVGVLVWIAENIGSLSQTWLYPHQRDGWDWVELSKIGSWSLLMIVSLVLVSALHRPDRRDVR